MTKSMFYLSIFLLIAFFAIHGCAYSVSQIKTKEGIVRVGMGKGEVLDIWGEPHHEWYREQSLDSNEWNYPRRHWWGGRITLWFDEKGIVKAIEVVQD